MILDGKNLKNGFERFMYHDHMSFTSLEQLVETWEPKKEKYKKLEEIVSEFLEYYTKNTEHPFPDDQIENLKSIIDKSKYLLF